MSSEQTIYILGAGAVGFPLAVHLARDGRRIVAVRTRASDAAAGAVEVTVDDGQRQFGATIETVALAGLGAVEGLLVVTAKAHANEAIARALQEQGARGDVVVLQNGVGVEQPFLDAGFTRLYRSVLYLTGQAMAERGFLFRPVTTSVIGVIQGDQAGLEQCVAALNTAAFPFRTEANIQREIWKKAIINSVFNSVCPLLDVDNGIFVRQEDAAQLAQDVIRECVALTDRLGLELSEEELMEQLLLISRRSDGQLISTLQDMRAGRPTEIPFLNVAIARVAASMQPPLELPRTALLGEMVLLKGAQPRTS